MSRLTSLFFIG